MTTLDNRPNTALLVIDVQKGVVGSAWERESVISNINLLVDRARDENIDVVWVQHSADDMPIGTEGWQIVDELNPRDSEAIVRKLYGDSFEATDLEQVLADKGVGRLIVTGAQTDACVRSTLHGAFTRGYDTILVGDAHTTEDLSAWGAPSPDKVISHTNLYWGFQDAPGRTAGVIETADVDFSSEQRA